jgi:hypothetical protein
MALTADTQIPTSEEWVRLDMLNKEHVVFDQLGQPVNINTIQHYTPTECYELEFDDGLSIQGDRNLVLMLQDKKWRDRLGESLRLKDRKMYRGMRRPLVRLTVEELYDNGLHHKDGRLNYSVPNCLPVQYGHKDLPVPPYIFGIWFATLSPTGRHWLRDRPLDKMQRIFRTYGHFIKTRKHKNGDVLFDIRPSVRDSFLFAGVNIPTCLPFYYLDGDVDQRKELLQGFIDGGFIKKSKTTDLYTAKNANYKLMRKIQGLVESFGIKTVLHTPNKTMYYTLKFRTFQDFAQLNVNFPIIYGKNRRFVTKITKIPPKPCVHVDTGTQFLVGEGFISVC